MTHSYRHTGQIAKPDMAKPIGIGESCAMWLKTKTGDVQSAARTCLTEKNCKLITNWRWKMVVQVEQRIWYICIKPAISNCTKWVSFVSCRIQVGNIAIHWKRKNAKWRSRGAENPKRLQIASKNAKRFQRVRGREGRKFLTLLSSFKLFQNHSFYIQNPAGRKVHVGSIPTTGTNLNSRHYWVHPTYGTAFT